MLTALQKKAIATLDNNRLVKGTKYTPPSPHHYPNGYLWDSEFVAIVYARLGQGEKARQELEEVLSWQNKKTGFIPNIRLGKGRYFDLELLTFQNPKFSSDYTQPPFHAQAAWEIYKSLKAKEGVDFLRKNYNSLYLAYKYFIDFRENGNNSHLVGVIHPHETGRDSDPTFDFSKKRIQSRGNKTNRLVRYINSGLDYASALHINVKLAKSKWNVKKIRKNKVFWVNDVMFNCIYAQNLAYMAMVAKKINKKRDAKFYESKYEQVTYEIINNLWDTKDEMFFAKNNNKFIHTISVSNLAPIMLKETKTQQVEKLLILLEDKRMFNAPFPIPSVPISSQDFDPHYHELRLWRGTVWINTNWIIIEGLKLHYNRFKKTKPDLAKRLKVRADYISKKTRELTNKYGFWEFYNPLSGKGMRIDNFAWSTLAAIIE